MTDFCPKCTHFEMNLGVCSKIHENVERYPKRFNKRCNSRYYINDPKKKFKKNVSDEPIVDYIDMNELVCTKERIYFVISLLFSIWFYISIVRRKI